MSRRLISFCLTLLVLVGSVAEAAPGNGQNSTRSPKKALSVIVLAGVAGAILGLSTLSFYGRPQERLSNIAIGAAIGVIGGALYTTVKAATEPRDFYNSGPPPPTRDRLVARQFTPTLKYNFQF